MFDLFSQPAPEPTVQELRDAAMASVSKHAGLEFAADAREFIKKYLAEHGPTPGEVITDACKAAGIKPHDDRAFGPVYYFLCRTGVIEKDGTCTRKKGHLTAGGNIWKLTTT